MSYKRIRATGHGAFPVDMLRFLQAWPATSEDAARLHDSIRSEAMCNSLRDLSREIVLECKSTPMPDYILARFDSFGWRAELMDRFGTHPMQGPSEPVADVAQQVREPMTPELMELRERSNPHPGADITRAVQQRTETRSNWPFRTNRGG